MMQIMCQLFESHGVEIPSSELSKVLTVKKLDSKTLKIQSFIAIYFGTLCALRMATQNPIKGA